MSKFVAADRREIVSEYNMVEFENFTENNNVLIVGGKDIIRSILVLI